MLDSGHVEAKSTLRIIINNNYTARTYEDRSLDARVRNALINPGDLRNKPLRHSPDTPVWDCGVSTAAQTPLNQEVVGPNTA